MPDWTAEVDVDPELAAALVRAQFRLGGSVRLLSEGWDYAVYLVGDEWAFRFPRRAVVVPGTERELAVLPHLTLPVAIPKPVHVGRPTAEYPWPFYGSRFIPVARQSVSTTPNVSLLRGRWLEHFGRCTTPRSTLIF